MIGLLSKIFIKNSDDVKNPQVRHAYGVMMSIVGIVVNIALSAVKLVFGTISGSISVTADAMNNLSDAGSQIISLISFKISSKPADRDHPFGHARMEYISSMIVSFIILLVGFELLIDSGELGELVSFAETRNMNYFADSRPRWFLKKELSGGGIMIS